MEAHCVNLELKYQNQALKEGQHGQFSKAKSNKAKVKHDIDVTETINIELEHKMAKLLKENETLKRHYKEVSDSIKITRVKTIEHTTSLIAENAEFKAQLQKRGFSIAALKITKHYLPKGKESACAKSHHMIAPGSSRSQSIANGSKPKPRINNKQSRNWPAFKTSYVTTKTVPISEHSRNFRNFSDSKHFVCSTCQKCVFNADHDSCVTKFLKEVNSCTKVPSNKTTNINKPVEQTSFAKKPERQIPKDIVGLRWVPTGKIFTSSTTKVDSEPTNGSNEDITNQYECEQTLNVSACTLNLSTTTSFNPKKEGLKV
nr:hypothetical protein [Tanacetum cinerariifolium]